MELKNELFTPRIDPMLPLNSFTGKLAYVTGGGTG